MLFTGSRRGCCGAIFICCSGCRWCLLSPTIWEKNYREPLAVALYGLDLVLCSSAFYLLRIILLEQDRNDPSLADYHAAVQRKNAFSAGLYLLSVPLAYLSIYASFLIFALIPAMYFLPEKKLAASSTSGRLAP